MANDSDITFTIGFDVDKAKQKEAFNKISYSFMNSPLAKLSRSERKELNSFQSRHSEELANQTLKRFLNTPERGVGLFAKANKYRNEHDAMSKLMGVGSLPTAPAHEQYLALKQFKQNNLKEQKAYEAKLSALASSLDETIGSSADNKIKDMMKERGINEGLLAKAERLKTASSIDDFVAPLADNRIDNAIKAREAKEEEISRVASSIDETIGKSFDERINNIKIPTKETHEFDDVINGFNNNDGGLNVFEDKNRAYLNLLKQRNDAKKKYDKSGDIDALKEYTSADQQLKALKDQEKEKKNNAKEEKGSLIRFGKMLVTLHLIKKVLNSIKDIWKRLSDTELKVTGRDVKEKGFFSIDSYSAMHANVDRSHAVISRGLGYMGAAAPFSMDAFDSVLKQLQDLNLKAISGQGIADEQLVISLQRLSDTLGMGFNIKDVLTDPNLNLTDFLTNLMNSVEKFLPKLNSLDDIKKSLVTNDIIKALGPELANALVYNFNYNQRTGGTSTVMEQVTSKGTNAYGLIDYTEEAKKFTDALASSRAALDEFKTTLGGFFAPAGKKIANQATEKLAEGTMLVNALKSKSSDISYTLVHSGASEIFSKDREELSEWYKNQENQENAAKKLEDAKDFSSLDDVLNYAYYNPTALAAGTPTVGLEKTIGIAKGNLLAERIRGKTFSELDKDSFSEEEWAAINDLYYGHRGKNSKWVFNGNGKDIFETKSWQKFFAQDGAYDFNPSWMSPTGYAKRMIGEEAYQALLIKLLSEENNLLHEAGIMKEGGFGYYTKDEVDAQGNKISGTVVLRLELSDGTYRDIPTKFEEGVVNAIVNVPSLQ
jgi:hypothetical protein